MKRLVLGSALFALVTACSGSTKPDDSVPVSPPPSQPVPGDAGATVSPPENSDVPSDVPQGSVHHAAPVQLAQRPDAGIGRIRDAGAPSPSRDAGIPARDAGAPDAGGAPAPDAGAPPSRPAPAPSRPGPGSAPPPGSPGPSAPSGPPASPR